MDGDLRWADMNLERHGVPPYCAAARRGSTPEALGNKYMGLCGTQLQR